MKQWCIVVMMMICVGCSCVQAGVVATVGSDTITDDDVNTRLELLPPQYKSFYATEEGKKKLVDQLVQEKLIYLKASTEGYDKNPDVLTALENAKRNIIISKYVQNIFKSVIVSDADIQAYYQEHKDSYMQKEQIQAKHILLKTEKEALAARARIVKGESFEKVAQELSQDTGSGKNGGDLGWFAKGEMVKPFEEIAFALKESEISMPVKTQFGYHIIKLYGKKALAQKTLDEVKDEIKSVLTEKKQRDMIDAMTTQLKETYPVVIK